MWITTTREYCLAGTLDPVSQFNWLKFLCQKPVYFTIGSLQAACRVNIATAHWGRIRSAGVASTINPPPVKSILKDFIHAHVKQPSEEEMAEILSIFEERTYSKGDFFKEAHTIAREIGFITSGSAKSVVVKDNGEERLGRLLPVGFFLFDLISVRKEEKTPIAITFREPSTVLVAPYPTIKALLETNLTLNIMVREYTADRTVEMGKWLMMFAMGTAKDRYHFILENNPTLLNKLSLRMIASMIGITPTQLSRIRNQKE